MSTSVYGAGSAYAVTLDTDQTIVSSKTFKAKSALAVPLTAQAASGQTGNLFEIKNETGAVLTRIASSGGIVTPSGSILGSAQNLLLASGPALSPLIVRGSASQTANLLEVQNDSGTVLAQISPRGPLQIFPQADAVAPAISVTGGNPAAPALVLRSAALQTANILSIQNNAGTELFHIEGTIGAVRAKHVDVMSNVWIGTGGTGTNDNLIKLRARASSAQTENLLQIENSAGTILTSINSAGIVRSPLSSNEGAVWRTTNEDGPDNNGYHVTWQAGTADNGTNALFWDGGQGLRCRYDGYYTFTAHIHTHSISQGVHQHVIRRNSDGAHLAEYYSGLYGGSRMTTTGPIYLGAGETILALVRSPDGIAYVHNGQGAFIRGFYLGPR